ncbi:hypothetical protein [Pseudomonas syringae]
MTVLKAASGRPARPRPFLPSNLKEGKRMDLVICVKPPRVFYPDRNMSRGWGEVMPSPDTVLQDPARRTGDLGGPMDCQAFGVAVAEALQGG